MQHLQTAVETSERSDIATRLAGRYYTPLNVAHQFASEGLEQLTPRRICDPFCGDGRLAISWVRRMARDGKLRSLEEVAIWDLDAEAVAKAENALRSELVELGASHVSIDARSLDAFMLEHESEHCVVVTNPPWEQLKPDSRDLVRAVDRYRSEIRSYSETLETRFPGSASSKKKSIGGYTVNLARAGALLAIKLVRQGGLLQIVLPSTIFGDQVSTSFRKSFFQSIDRIVLNHFPAEARLFDGVDQAVVTVSGTKSGPSSYVEIRRFKANQSLVDQRRHVLDQAEAPLPMAVGGNQHNILTRISVEHPSASWLESDLRFGLRLGRELDETRISEAFTTSAFGVPFLKGRNITRFGSVGDDLPHIDPALRRIPASVNERRAVWRDVSRPSQKRRIHATIIPSGIVTGNSLGIARFTSSVPNALETWLAVINSFVFEAQVRAVLATNHVSQGAIRKCAVPFEIFEDEEFRKWVSNKLPLEPGGWDVEIEIAIAKRYGLDQDEFLALLAGFEKLTDIEIAPFKAKEAWL